MLESTKRSTSLRVSPGVMTGHCMGTKYPMKAMITVGMANTSEKMNVLRHLRME